MKKTITLIIGILISISLIGQTTKIRNNHIHEKSRIKRIESLENNKKGVDNRRRSSKFVYGINSPQNFKSTNTVKQRLDSIVDIIYNESSNQWDNYGRNEFTYDTEENISQYTSDYWDDTDELWFAEEKQEYTYDTSGNVLKIITYEYYDADEGEWLDTFESEYTYDDNGLLTQCIYSGTAEFTDDWLTYGKDVYTYDVNNNMTQIYSYDWDEDFSEWLDSYKEDYTYDSNNNFTQILYSYWDEDSDQWISSDKDEFSYNVNGYLIEEIHFYWDEYFSQWLSSTKYETSYDTNGNPTLELSFDWDEDLGDWLYYDKYENTFDLSYNLSDLILPKLDDNYILYFQTMSNMITNDVSYEYIDDAWVETFKGTFYYSEQTNVTGVSNITKNPIKVYPNPTSEFITIDFGIDYHNLNLELIDIQGKTIIKKKISNNEQINIEQLPTGLYFYKLINGTNIIQSNKIIIK